ncbi:hypothetical protein V7S43_005567 [Phytophthora oleae]|uniref:RxLR effector protein n=1 Tax=Phytophthora oleae TaxID=2107226 RepID=A0ABD3FQM8_9STRA
MHLGQLFFATIAILLVSSDGIMASQKARTSLLEDAVLGPSSNSDFKRIRALRADDNSEERGFWSNLVKEAKVIWWLETGKSGTQVKKALKLDELSGKALKTNTKNFQKFATKAYAIKLNKWLQDDVTTSSVWTILELNKISPEKLKSSPAFHIYVDYVKQFDDLSIRKWGTYKLPEMVGPSKPEMMVNSSIWGETKRSDKYVKMALGMEGVSGKALKEHTNYAYYKTSWMHSKESNELALRSLLVIFFSYMYRSLACYLLLEV